MKSRDNTFGIILPSDLIFVYCHTAVFYFIRNFSTHFLVSVISVANLTWWGFGVGAGRSAQEK